MKRTKKINLKFFKFPTIGILALPIVVSAISIPIIVTNHTKNTKLNYYNLFSTFDNILDNLISLGIAADYHSLSNSGKTKYASYLTNYVNEEITKFVNIEVKTNQEIDRNAVNQLKVDTVVLNENMKKNEVKFENVVNNIAYSSRGDSEQALYHTPIQDGGYVWETQNSTDNALSILANDLDEIYDQINHSFTKKTNEIIKQNEKRISYIYENNQKVLANKTIGIIYGKTTDASKINQEFYFCSPYTYTMLYGENSKGIGMDFPEPIDKGFINETHGYKKSSWAIKADGLELISQFKNKFDYLVYCAPDISESITQDVVYNSEITQMLKNKDNLNQNFIVTTMGEWYTPAWGTIGKNYVLDNVVDWLKLIDLSDEEKWKPTKPHDLIRIANF